MFPCEDSRTEYVCPYPEKINRHGFVNISTTLVIDTSMERSSRVLQHGNQKIRFFKEKKLKLNVDLCQRAEIVQVGLHLYDDIGDASSSLRGSTSSFQFIFIRFERRNMKYLDKQFYVLISFRLSGRNSIVKFIEHIVYGFIKERGYPLSTNTWLNHWISLSNEIHEDDTLIALLTRVFW